MGQSKPWKLFGAAGTGDPRRKASDATSADAPRISRTATTRDKGRGELVASRLGAEFAAFPEPVLVIEPAGRLIAANEAAVDLANRVGVVLDHDRGVGALLGKVRLANGGGASPWMPLESGEWLNGLADLAAASAGEAVFELKALPRSDLDGRPIDIVVRLIDVTSLAEALRGRKAAEEHRDRFLKLLSHDMRSPLAAILTTLKHPDLSSLPTTTREIIEGASGQALAMVDAVVRLTRAECADYRFVELDFCHVVEEAIDACWAKAKSARVKIVLDPCDESFSILADRGYLTEALVELLLNFVDASVAGGVLSCSLESNALNGKAAVVLRIDGVGGGESANLFEQDDKLELFKTVVLRHGGVASARRDASSFRAATTFFLANPHGRDLIAED